jgi:methyl-accepting chemotaxis protein
MKITDYFLKNYSPENELEKMKANVLLMIILTSSAVVILVSIIYILTNLNNLQIETLPILLIAIISLFFFKKGKIKTAGNIATILLSIHLSINSIFNLTHSATYNFFINEYYVFLFAIMMSAMFASKKILYLNFAIIEISAFITFFRYYNHLDNIKQFAIIGFIVYNAIAYLIFTLSHIFIKFLNKSIEKISEDIENINQQNNKLNQLFEGINTSSNEVEQSSIQLSRISEQISQSSAEQAASTEQISASVQQILASVKTNNINAENSHKVIIKNQLNLENNTEKLLETLELVKQISKKIAVVTEIATKTDILSINATIEAAKAGDAGKGFAVVAQEIRKLADNSKKAAKDIKNFSDKGMTMSDDAIKTLKIIAPEYKQIADAIENIIISGNEQLESIEEINSSLMQLANVANENAVSAEEMSASAEELTAQAKSLNDLITIND